jgi:hypothetical protein
MNSENLFNWAVLAGIALIAFGLYVSSVLTAEAFGLKTSFRYPFKRILQRVKQSPKLCKVLGHDWEINQMVDRHGRLQNHCRICWRCRLMQELRRPEKYHPTKLVWVDTTVAYTHAPLHVLPKTPINQRVSELIKRTK